MLEEVALNEGSAENNQTRSEFGSADRLFHRKTADRLDRNLHRCYDLSQLIERTGIWPSHCREAAAFIVPDMVNDVIAAEVLQPFCGRDPVLGSEIVTHDFQTEILCGLDHRFDRLRMSALHDHDMGCSRFCCQLSLKPTAIHGFQVSHDGNAGKLGAQSTNTVHSFGDDERSARLNQSTPERTASRAVSRALEMEVKSSEICTMIFIMSLRNLPHFPKFIGHRRTFGWPGTYLWYPLIA